MFKKGENVLYGANGIYIVEDIRCEDFLGEKREYYVLSQPERKSNDKVFIPLDNEKLVSQIKPLLTREEIFAMIKSIPSEPMKWINETRARSEHFKNIFARADRAEITHLAITVYLRKIEMESQEKKIFVSDENTLARAEKLIYDEFSRSIDIPRENVIQFIMDEMKK